MDLKILHVEHFHKIECWLISRFGLGWIALEVDRKVAMVGNGSIVVGLKGCDSLPYTVL